MVTTPLFPAEYINENFAITSTNSINKTNTFFELAIVFNEKLQQFIAFFTHLSDEVAVLAKNELTITDISSAQNIQTANKKCTKSN